MTSPKTEFFDFSAATRAAIAEQIPLHVSSATMVLPEAESTGVVPDITRSRARRYPGTVLYSAMLPLAVADDYAFRRRHDADTATAYVYFIGEWEPDLLESPSIIAVWPQRQTYRFSSDRPARRLPKRKPFISPSALVIEVE